jgi:hypothetical protein
LAQLKADVSKLEREISINIQKNQMKHEAGDDKTKDETKETPVVKMEKSLLPKKDIIGKKAKGIRV